MSLASIKRVCAALVTGSILLLAACSPIAEKGPGGSAPKPGASTGAPPAAATGPKRGGALKMVQSGDIVSPNPWPSTLSRHALLRTLYNTPFRLDAQRKPQPELAESWEVTPDGKTITLKLRKGVLFHNSRELTADDIAWTLQWTQNPKTRSQIGPMLQGATAKVIDPLTVSISWKDSANQLWDALNELFVVAKESLPEIDRKPVGTGPFKVKDYQPGQVIMLARHDKYFKPGLPYLDELAIEMLPDAAAMLVAFDSGAAGMVRQPPSQELGRLKTAGKQVLVSKEVTNTLAYAFDTKKPPFKDKRVRQAINLAVDRKRMVETALFGVGRPICIPWPENQPTYDAALDKACQFDIEKAKAMLKEAGAEGLTINLIVSTGSFPEHTRMAQILQSDLGKIGVQVNIRDIEAAQWQTTVSEGKFPPDSGMGVYLFGRTNQDPMLLFTARPYRTRDGATGFESAEFTRLVNEGAAATDMAKRLPMYAQVTKLMYDEAFMLPISPLARQWVLQPYVRGFAPDRMDREVFEEVWLDR